MTDYPQIISRLLSVNVSGGMKLGLKNCLDIDNLLGNPSQSFPVIHIAGTNGKGSVSTKIAAAYQASGKKVGLYTSPHISCFRERIRTNGQMIPEKNALKHLTTLFSLCEQNRITPTFFELTTMLAFLHFASENVDAAVLEVGLGGRLDATNISRPILSIITSISLEHTEILGGTIEAIAQEKAGIIKKSIPVIIGPNVPKHLVEKIAKENESLCIHVSGIFDDYHAENCAIAKQACERLGLSQEAIEVGLKALPPCRLETFAAEDMIGLGFSSPLPKAVILDVAHNPDGLKQLIKALTHRYGNAPLRFVLGLSSNKDVKGCLSVILDKSAGFHLTEGCNERGVPKELLAEELIGLGVPREKITCAQSIKKAIEHAIQIAGKNNELVVVCGTFFIMGQVREALGISEPQDPVDMNER